MESPSAPSPLTPLSKQFTESLASDVSLATRVRVVCRVRPLSLSEAIQETKVVLIVDDKTVCIQEKETPSAFTYDTVFGDEASQEDIYETVGKKTLGDFFKGFNGTILAYGQTGAGKSYTMMGQENGISTSDLGIIPRISQNIFTHIAESLDEVEYTVALSMLEVYKEHIFDLLDPQSKSKEYSIHEDKTNGVHVRGLSQAFVSCASEMAIVIKQGCKNRRTGSTNMNSESSRSHLISQVILTQKDITSGEVRKSHLFLVDLAGSEKVDRSGATGVTLEEARKINLSLSVLGLVINSLTDPKVSHIPYRDSKLTRILQESLGGNSRTTLIINISPASGSIAETVSTLRFGSRAKKIRNTVHINTELSVDQLKARIASLERQNKELEAELDRFRPEKSSNLKDHDERNNADADKSLFLASSPLLQKSRAPGHDPLVDVTDLRGTFLPVTPNEALPSFQDELRRKDEKINQLEQEVLKLKMVNLTTLHNEDLKLFRLECALYKLNDKLSDVELINTNLRRHLQVSEKIIQARGLKIEKLRELVSEQQEQVNRESFHFESKLKVLKDKFDAQKMRVSMKLFPDNSYEAELLDEYNTVQDSNIQLTPKRVSAKSFSSDKESPGSPKMGLNLRIVKPLRGGKSSSDSLRTTQDI